MKKLHFSKSILEKQGELHIYLNIQQMITDYLIWWLTPNYSSAKSKIKNVHINFREIVSVKMLPGYPGAVPQDLYDLELKLARTFNY